MVLLWHFMLSLFEQNVSTDGKTQKSTPKIAVVVIISTFFADNLKLLTEFFWSKAFIFLGKCTIINLSSYGFKDKHTDSTPFIQPVQKTHSIIGCKPCWQFFLVLWYCRYKTMFVYYFNCYFFLVLFWNFMQLLFGTCSSTRCPRFLRAL